MEKKKKKTKNVKFKDVQVYYFPREQGFGVIPHEGGSTLGMAYKHTGEETLSLGDHVKARKMSFLSPDSKPQDDTASKEDLERSGKVDTGPSNTESVATSSKIDNEALDLENEDWYISTKRLKPENRLTPAQRRLLLRQSGVVKIDKSEEIDCKEIRDSRRKVGCSCRRGCSPETCSCSKAGIPCFVEGETFPCKCIKTECRNPTGRREYSYDSVWSHFTLTIDKLKRQGD